MNKHTLFVMSQIYPSCGDFTSHTRTTRAGVCLLNSAGSKILLVPQKSKKWGIPKGGMKFYETIWTSAARELMEETELDLHTLKVYFVAFEWFDHIYKTDLGAGLFVFRLDGSCPVMTHVQSHDIAGIPRWVHLSHLSHYKLNKTTRKLLKRMKLVF